MNLSVSPDHRRGSLLVLFLLLAVCQQFTLIKSFSVDVNVHSHSRRRRSVSVAKDTNVLRKIPLPHSHSINPTKRVTALTALAAVSKRQTAIFDGGEFMSIASVLKAEGRLDESHDDESMDVNEVPDNIAGHMTFVTGTIEGDATGKRILAIERTIKTNENKAEQQQQQEDIDKIEDLSDMDLFVEMEEGTLVYKDSITTIPTSISDVDAISTAASSLSVRCAFGESEYCNTVVLGGGDYACFLAKAVECLNTNAKNGSKVNGNGDGDGDGVGISLVTTRPMSLKDTPLNPLRGTSVNAMPPAIGEDEVGFSEHLGNFDAVIDTLGDEAKLTKSKSFEQSVDRAFGEVGVASKLKRDNGCERYISTLTHSQQIVLVEGILFARDPVLKYQKEMEQLRPQETSEDGEYHFMNMPPPANYNKILQVLFDDKVIFPTDKNENGSHTNKEVFIRGCSFPDYAELEIWPSDTTNEASVRYGFPGIEELSFEAKVDKMMTDNNISNEDMEESDAKKKVQRNPYVTFLDTLNDVRQYIVTEKKDAVVFFAAPYCKTCKSITPLYQRMARISKDVKGDKELLFAKASIAGKSGKQMTFTFQIDSVPTFLLFRKGKQFGEPFGVVKLPSKRLTAAIDLLQSGEDWDPRVMEIEERNKGVQRTKLQ